MERFVSTLMAGLGRFFKQGLRRLVPDRLEIAVLLILAAAASFQLFIEPVVGIADNRDFARLMDPVGLDYQSVASYRESVFQFVETKFVFGKTYSHRYMTSQRPILDLARAMNRMLSKDGSFDLRCLGFCNLVLYLGAVLVFLRAFRQEGMARRLFVAAAVLVVCSDVRLICYFNSFYCESASLIFLFSTSALAMLCIQSKQQGSKTWVLWCAYMVSSLLFWMAKSQNAAFVPCLTLGVWCFFPRSPCASHGRYVRVVATAALPVGVVLAFALGAYGASVSTNAQVVLDEEILPHSPQPDADVLELRPGGERPTLSRVARFYLHHPGRWWQMAERQAKESFGYPLLGNFTRASGLGPKAQSQAFNHWSELKKARFPRSLTLLTGLLVAYWVLAGARIRAGRVDPMRALFGPVLGLACALELIATVTFEANGTAKHLFIFNVAVDICILIAALDLTDTVRRLWRRRRGTPVTTRSAYSPAATDAPKA